MNRGIRRTITLLCVPGMNVCAYQYVCVYGMCVCVDTCVEHVRVQVRVSESMRMFEWAHMHMWVTMDVTGVFKCI